MKLNGNIYNIGFPSNLINKVIDVLKNNNVNYIILNKGNGYCISDKYKVNKNNYSKYKIDYKRLEYLNNRISLINNKLLDNIFSKDIENILFKIESIL